MGKNIERLAEIGEITLREEISHRLDRVDLACFIQRSTQQDLDKISEAVIDSMMGGIRTSLSYYKQSRELMVSCGLEVEEYDNQLRQMKVYESFRILKKLKIRHVEAS